MVENTGLWAKQYCCHCTASPGWQSCHGCYFPSVDKLAEARRKMYLPTVYKALLCPCLWNKSCHRNIAEKRKTLHIHQNYTLVSGYVVVCKWWINSSGFCSAFYRLNTFYQARQRSGFSFPLKTSLYRLMHVSTWREFHFSSNSVLSIRTETRQIWSSIFKNELQGFSGFKSIIWTKLKIYWERKRNPENINVALD